VQTRVFDALGRLETPVLIELTHREGPWLKAVARARRTNEAAVELTLADLEAWCTPRAGAFVARAIKASEDGNPEAMQLVMLSLAVPPAPTCGSAARGMNFVFSFHKRQHSNGAIQPDGRWRAG
jgi:hypothetical protein